jgi:hypothetical protein
MRALTIALDSFMQVLVSWEHNADGEIDVW